ncbi:hypothetical protein CB0940_09103 [Cercospora beticola]|uniref:Protein kinase domain-containing protein n=1 Tax=Cercospora beticola TaxID=122368 RepID=A0A2G5HGL7_CERBT|nr:hypothetical protein CB0940_09103 [Cercospora beticola]PIA91382.1 hypothetical protein CB0940_09103 [Cercospora beticola]WPB06615.1 hypothetical protein RHO25_011272 [Cercospora beticola]
MAGVAPTPAALNLNLANVEQQKHLIGRLGDGMYSVVEATITIEEFTGAQKQAQDLNYQQPVDIIARMIAPELRATKIFQHQAAAPITDECEIIAYLARHANTSIMNFYPGSKWTQPGAAVGGEFWVDFEVVTGGTLTEFDRHLGKEKDPADKRAPIGFCWHIAEQLFSALLLIHFDGGNRSKYYHGDIKKSNILLRPSTDNANRYPDVVLTDFGSAQELPNRSTPGVKHQFWGTQQDDSRDLGRVITWFSGVRDRTLQELIKDLGRLHVLAPNGAGNVPTQNFHLRRAMRNLVRAAQAYRVNNAFQPLPAQLLKTIDKRCLNDQALRKGVTRVLKSLGVTASRAESNKPERRSTRQTSNSPDELSQSPHRMPGVRTRAQAAGIKKRRAKARR